MPLPSWGNGHRRPSTLTKLPPRLKHARTASQASTTAPLSPEAPPSPQESEHTVARAVSVSASDAEGEHRVSDEFEALLRAAPGEADVRQSVRSSLVEWEAGAGHDEAGRAPRRPSLANCRRETGNHSHEGESLLVLPGGEMGVTGRDALLLVQELHRLRVARSRRVHRHLALWGGVVTLVVLLASFWVLVEAIAALSQGGGKGALGKVRFVQLGFMLLALAVRGLNISWLKTRRPSRLSIPSLVLTLITASTHVGLAFTNCVLVGIYKSSRLASACDWSIDVAWTLGNHACDSPSDHYTGYAAAASVRFLVTLTVALVWLASLRTFWRSLAVVSIVDPSTEPTAEVREILARHSAQIVPLHPHLHQPLHDEDDHDRHEHLPHMPDRRTGQVSEATQASFESSRTVKALGWLGRAVEWLIGPAVGKAAEGEPERAAYAPADDDAYDEEKALGATPVARYAPDRSGLSSAVHRPSIDLSDKYSSSAASSRRQSVVDPARYKELFSGLGGRSPARSREATPAASEDGQGDATPRPSSEHSQDHAQPAQAGHGGLIYVRMSDGRLVRKLSTIASASEPATAAFSEAGHAGRDRSGSFHSCASGTATDLATFREVEWRHGMRWEMESEARLPRAAEGSEGEEVVVWVEGAGEGGGWREGRLGGSVGGA